MLVNPGWFFSPPNSLLQTSIMEENGKFHEILLTKFNAWFFGASDGVKLEN